VTCSAQINETVHRLSSVRPPYMCGIYYGDVTRHLACWQLFRTVLHVLRLTWVNLSLSARLLPGKHCVWIGDTLPCEWNIVEWVHCMEPRCGTLLAWPSRKLSPILCSLTLCLMPCVRVKVKLLSILYAFMLVGVSIFPFLLHQLHGYQLFCVPAAHDMPREWCKQTIPATYSFVQAYYWNVGLLKYWRVYQIPNFLLPSPPLVLLVCSAVTTIRASFPYLANRITSIVSGKGTTKMGDADDPGDIEMLPHALHALIMASILIFVSHTQIALRALPTLPFMHWSVAGLFTHKPGPAKAWWMYWCVIWWAMSCVLWGAFLPPA